MALTQPIRNPKDVQKLLTYFKNQGDTRNYLLATIAIHTALRISDILNLNCNHVYDFEKRKVRKQVTLIEQKSKKPKIIALNKAIISVLKSYLPQASPNTPLILNKKTGNAISRIQAYRIIRQASEAIELESKVSCHSLRKTFGYHAWKNGASPVLLMDIYNHSSYNITKRYLGITQDDKNTVFRNLNI